MEKQIEKADRISARIVFRHGNKKKFSPISLANFLQKFGVKIFLRQLLFGALTGELSIQFVHEGFFFLTLLLLK